MKHFFVCASAVLCLILAAAVAAADPAACGLTRNETRIADVAAGQRPEVVASWWGFDPADATAALQSAIDSGAARVVVPYTGAPWVIRPVRLRGDLELTFEPGVVVLAKAGEFKGGGDSLFSAKDAANITVRGYGARLRMRKGDYQSDAYERAEWRMTLSFSGCRNVRVEGLSLESSGGDGIYIGATEALPRCEDVVIRDVLCWNHHRQGVSVISAKNLLIENCRFIGTKGTAPQAGIDLEPNSADECLVNVTVRSCTMANNWGAGILVYLKPLRRTSESLSILFENCHVRSGNDQGIGVGAVGDDGPGGLIEFRNCTVENTRNGGAYIYDKSAEAALVRFANCQFRNTATRSTEKRPWWPLVLSLNRDTITKRHGGVEFADCAVYDDLDRAALKTEEDKGSKGALNVTGTIRRCGPGAARAEFTPESAGCTLEVVPF